MTTAALRSPRDAYRDVVAELMPADDRLVCLDTDTGVFDGVDFGPAADRYFNLGIAEHTMMGAAAGLAKEGRIVLAHTMAAFASSRAVEAVKIDIALNNLPVVICATHSGLSAGSLGPTHHALEDLAAMRALPNMQVVVPVDEQSTRDLVVQGIQSGRPVYVRLGRNATPPGPELGQARLGQAQTLRLGRDITVAACGAYPLLAASAAADLLETWGVSAHVLHCHTVVPLDTAALVAAAERTGGEIVTVEEHWATGGFGSAVAEALCEVLPVRVHKVAVPHRFVGRAGDQEYLLSEAGISAESVAETSLRALTSRQGSPLRNKGDRT